METLPLFNLFFSVFSSLSTLFEQSQLLLTIFLVCAVLTMFEIILHFIYGVLDAFKAVS